MKPQAKEFTNLVQAMQVFELSLASITVIRRMLILLVLSQLILGFEDICTLIAGDPVFSLFVLETQLSCMSRPAGVTPSAFDLIGMSVAIVEMVTDAIEVEPPATTFRHLVCRISCLSSTRWVGLELKGSNFPKSSAKSREIINLAQNGKTKSFVLKKEASTFLLGSRWTERRGQQA